MAIAEAYPDLKADKNFLALQIELSNTEDRIQAARRFHNGNVRDYQNRYESFPGNLVAKLFNFAPREFLNVEPAVRVAPSIEGAFQLTQRSWYTDKNSPTINS
jgi:LemA protein